MIDDKMARHFSLLSLPSLHCVSWLIDHVIVSEWEKRLAADQQKALQCIQTNRRLEFINSVV